jgi:hypothetical protein
MDPSPFGFFVQIWFLKRALAVRSQLDTELWPPDLITLILNLWMRATLWTETLKQQIFKWKKGLLSIVYA